MDFVDLSSVAGLIATVLLSLNLLLGMMLGTAYKKHRFWKQIPVRFRRISLFDLHNWTACLALFCVLVHPVLLLFAPEEKFTWTDLVFPLHAPHQKTFVALGSVSMLIVILVVLSSQAAIREKLRFRRWKAIHLLSYAAAMLFIIHGIAMDPQLKDRPVDFFDAEKVVSELCAVILLAATLLRYRYHLRSIKIRKKKLIKKGA